MSLAQLTSRICHDNENVFQLLEQIFVQLLGEFPHQTVWLMAGLNHSKHLLRKRRCQIVLRSGKNEHSGLREIYEVYGKLVEQLLKLGDKKFPKDMMQVNLHAEFASLHRSTPLTVLVPITRALNVTLSSDGGGSGAQHNHQAFPSDLPTIEQFGQQMDLLTSLVRPKKICMIGSDGECPTPPPSPLSRPPHPLSPHKPQAHIGTRLVANLLLRARGCCQRFAANRKLHPQGNSIRFWSNRTTNCAKTAA